MAKESVSAVYSGVWRLRFSFQILRTSQHLVIYQIKASLFENVPHLRQASRNTGHDVLLWARLGTPLRALVEYVSITHNKPHTFLYYVCIQRKFPELLWSDILW
ncbi:hypothetical protein HYC85_015419 [Camellia sinensis]|uniref:Uncharacterized protein n=1 Tax=Camellia sinensis TaxID=4442 RepID=A0A7J7GYZ5_CAMSI|nr:hypothetical protein HYC85_015419 [Camellia sinensis]